jgi:uncharacterized Zn-finger protein
LAQWLQFATLPGMNKNSTSQSPAPASLNAAPERLVSKTRKVVCDGPEFSKHPRIYLSIGAEGEVTCPYCSRQFVLVADPQDEAH